MLNAYIYIARAEKDHVTRTHLYTLHICCANLIARFDALIEELQALNPKAATYLQLAELKLWAKAHFVGTRFGYNTSNVVELVNKDS
jgi:hypothetical protein